MLTGIISTHIPEVNPEFPCICRDCGVPMSSIAQPIKNGTVTLITCWNRDCLLSTVTLSIDQYNSLNETELENYRAMNRARALGLHLAKGQVSS